MKRLTESMKRTTAEAETSDAFQNHRRDLRTCRMTTNGTGGVSVGDRVQVKREYDETWLLFGHRSPAGTVDHMNGEMAVVNLDDGKAVSYPPEQLEAA